jgi:hypothetical protein
MDDSKTIVRKLEELQKSLSSVDMSDLKNEQQGKKLGELQSLLESIDMSDLKNELEKDPDI